MEDDDKDKGNEPETKDEPGATPDELGEAGKRALQSERKARAAAEKRLKELETEAKAREDAEKTEAERLQSQVAELTKRAEASEAQVVRYEVAAAKGLTPAQARRLQGSTKEELEADADELRVELGLKDEPEGKDDDPADDGGRPKENLRAGASTEDDEQPDAAQLADSILKSGW